MCNGCGRTETSKEDTAKHAGGCDKAKEIRKEEKNMATDKKAHKRARKALAIECNLCDKTFDNKEEWLNHDKACQDTNAEGVS